MGQEGMRAREGSFHAWVPEGPWGSGYNCQTPLSNSISFERRQLCYSQDPPLPTPGLPGGTWVEGE